MKKAVVTLAIGEKYGRIAALTHPLMRAYAGRIGAEFVPITEPSISRTTPHYEKFQIFHLLNKYERIAYVDTDVIVRDDCPDLFDVVPKDQFGAFNEGAFMDRVAAMSEVVKQTGLEVEKWDGQYYNTGVMVLSRRHKFLFSRPEIEVSNFYEQSLVNLRLVRGGVKVHGLEYRLNRMTCMDKLLGEHRLASYLVHYAGFPGDDEKLLSLIESDIQAWRENPKHEYRRNVFIKVHGGLGDEMCAEPVIRYIATRAYKDARIIIETWFPRLFEHIPGVEIHFAGEFKGEKDQCYYVMDSMLAPETPAWKYMSANLMHTTDFCSLCCLRRVLTDQEKQPVLVPRQEDHDEVAEIVPEGVEELVIVHPGKGWASKTFPSKFWNGVIMALRDAGMKVGVIGKWLNDDQGTVPVEIPDGVLDLRNLLSMGGLISLLGRARAIVSNDSGPIHIASAFDTYVVLIPSCKHPDHVLHVRNGNRYWRAEAVYKKLTCDMIDSTPTQVHGQTIDYVVGDIWDYLPGFDDVVQAAKRAFTTSTTPLASGR